MDVAICPDQQQAGILASLWFQVLDQAIQQRVCIRPITSQFFGESVSYDIEPTFNQLVQEWKSNRRASSFSASITNHPAYLRIIGLGKDALPLILRELERKPDHWFVALKAISGVDPVPPQSRGNMRAMADAWLVWGRENGYAR